MSTKITMCYDDDYHFYIECHDRSNVYLQLPNDLIDQVPHYSGTETRIKIPVRILRQMVEMWNKDGWTDEEGIELLADYQWPKYSGSTWPGENEG